MSNDDCLKKIIEFLKNPKGKTNGKIKYRALSYVIIGNELLKNTPQVLLKCLSESEAYLEISDTHCGLCGAHQTGYKIKWLLFRQGAYLPNMLEDCIEFAQRCQECKKQRNTTCTCL